ncbi:MAG TPA: glyoxalase [Cyclobacteriaceae bacterium]|nr:glyoxalase [Cyclobacteriaceae bacterium]
MQSLTPNFFVHSIGETQHFYERLGFREIARVPESGEVVWLMMQCGEVSIMMQSFQSLGDSLPMVSRANGGSLLLYIKTKNIRKFYDQLQGDPCVVTGLEKTFYGATEFSVRDNNNYLITFAEDE